jgi:hypothetical protein
MLLRQPLPIFLFARLWRSAVNASLGFTAGPQGLPGREVPTQGMPWLTDHEMDALNLGDDLYRAAILNITDQNADLNQVIQLPRPVYETTSYQQIDRHLPSGTVISKKPVAASAETVPVTVKRWGGPLDPTQASAKHPNGQVAPVGVESLDALFAVYSLRDVGTLKLKYDFDRTIDTFVQDLFQSASNTTRPRNMVDDTTPQQPGDFPMSMRVIDQAEKDLDDVFCPTFDNGRRMMVLDTTQCLQLGNDRQFARQAEFHRDFNRLYTGTYWKTIGNFDIFKSQTLTKIPTGGAGIGGTVNTDIHSGLAFGPGMIGTAMAKLPAVYSSTDDNYEQTQLFLWLFFGGFANLDPRFGTRIRTS